MSEERMVEAVQGALEKLSIDERVVAAGQFMPRGHTGSLFAGGLVADSAASGFGGLADSIATVGGSIGAYKMHDAASGLPSMMLVGVTPSYVFGFAGVSRRKVPEALVFAVRRTDLEVKVHARVNVRVLELIDSASGHQIELEGSRVPVTHAKDVINELTSHEVRAPDSEPR